MFVRVEYENKKEFVEIIDSSDVNFEIFLKCGKIFSHKMNQLDFAYVCYVIIFPIKVAKAFDVQFSYGPSELSIVDQLDTPVRNLATLKYALDVFSKSGSFYFKVGCSKKESSAANLITSMVKSIS